MTTEEFWIFTAALDAAKARIGEQEEALDAADQFVEAVGEVAAELVRQQRPEGVRLIEALRDLVARTGEFTTDKEND